MSCQVVVTAGPARSGKTSHLLAAYRRELSGGGLGSALWLAPNYRAATEVAGRLLNGSLAGCLAPNLLTFNQLSRRVLATAAHRLRPISAAQTRTLLRGLIDRAVSEQRLSYFQPIAHTPGFLDLACGLIRELKRLEVWPEELLQSLGAQISPKDRELYELYAAYQELLTKHELYDAQGQFWAARRLLREGNWQALPAVRHVFVDGFTDFTRTEHEILELLAARAESLHISLLWDDGRDELFAKTRLTLGELERNYPALQIEHLPRRTGVPAALEHLERKLFDNSRPTTQLLDATGIEIMAAAGVTHEIELIARRVKRLLLGTETSAAVPARDILVVFRTLGETAALVREVFGRYGIPHVVDAAPPLHSAPLVSALLAWLRMDLEDWPFRELLDFVSHNYLQPSWPEWNEPAATALEWLVHELQIPSGRQRLLDAIGWHEQRGEEALVAKRKLAKRDVAARAVGRFTRRLAAVFDALPRQATCSQWADALDGLASVLGMREAARRNPLGDESAAQDDSAWDHLLAALREADQLAGWIAQPAAVLDRQELLALLADLAASETLPVAHDETGCVRVLPAEAARGLSAPYIFLAGLSERAFPPPQRDDCVLSQADVRRWSTRGLPLPSAELRGQFEMLLFYEAVTRATRHLVLSYPALDARAQPLVSSPYLSEVEHACGAGRIPRNEQPHLDCVPPNDDVLCVRDFRVRAVHQVLQGDERLYADFHLHPTTRLVARNVLHGLMITESRLRMREFGAYDGLFSAAAYAELAARFGPDRCWSPSQLETYAYCPYQFFMQRVLRLEPLGSPELRVDPMRRGQLMHWALSQSHRALNQQAGRGTSPVPELLEPFAEVVAQALAELRGQLQHDPLARGLREIDVRVIAANLRKYLDQHGAYDANWSDWDDPLVPTHFEVAFGLRGDEDHEVEQQTLPETADPLSCAEPFELNCGDEVLRFRGRIDRIDLGSVAGQTVFSVVDYKSGKGDKSTKLKAVLEGRSFQLPLYALAAEQLLANRGAVPFRAGYWHLSGDGYVDAQAVPFHVASDAGLAPAELWQELSATLRTRLRALIGGIRQGNFPMHSVDDECTSRCAYNTICRVNQARAADKHWEPPPRTA